MESFRRAERDKYVYRNDPSEYGFLCSNCFKRYGKPQRGGFVDITRCPKCPSLLQKERREVNRRLKS